MSEPGHSEQAIQRGTGRSWDQWVTAIDAGPGRDATHTEIAAWVESNSDVGAWWAQGVTVGYERITGLRLPGQMPDGTFTATRSRALAIDPTDLRSYLEDDNTRGNFLPDLATTRVSKAGVKAPRYRLADSTDDVDLGVVQFSFDATGAKTRLTVTHAKLPSPSSMEAWQSFWSAWLDVLEANFGGVT